MQLNANQSYKHYKSNGGDASFKEFLAEYNKHVPSGNNEKSLGYSKHNHNGPPVNVTTDFFNVSGDGSESAAKEVITTEKKPIRVLGMKPYQLGLVVIAGVCVYIYFKKKNQN